MAKKHKSVPMRKVGKTTESTTTEKHETYRHKPAGRQAPVLWIGLSLLLSLALIVSVATGGFHLDKIDSASTSISSILASTKSDEVKTALQSALDSLEEAKELLAEEKISNSASSGKVKVDFYVMSQCPYGTQVEDAIKPVLDKLGDSIDFSLNFISTDNGDGTFRSLHGEPETQGNIVQLCAAKYHPDKYMDMVVCMNKNAGNIPNNWETCANDNKLDVQKVKECYEGEEGVQLLSASIVKSNDAEASGSPTMYVDDELYRGGRQTLDFMKAVCNKLDNHPECVDIPACGADVDCTAQPDKIGKCENPGKDNAKCVYNDPETVNLIVINDEKCDTCDVSGLIGQLKLIFRGLKVTEYDFEDTKGRQMYDESDLQVLPAILFDSTVEKGEGYSNVMPYLDEAGEYVILRIGAQYDPLAEQCDNEVDDRDNDGLVDCEDDECENNIVCREEIEGRLDLYVMSQCPYGTRALDAMQQVLDNFKDIDFHINFIASDNGDGTFSSLHGDPEVQEDIRELCAIKYYPEDYKYMDYIWCRNTNIVSTAWESCASDNGMDVNKIKTCSEGAEGKELLSESIKITDELQIGASPTWLTNNKYLFSGIDAETVKTNYCQYNDDDGCENTLSSDTAGAPAGGSC